MINIGDRFYFFNPNLDELDNCDLNSFFTILEVKSATEKTFKLINEEGSRSKIPKHWRKYDLDDMMNVLYAQIAWHCVYRNSCDKLTMKFDNMIKKMNSNQISIIKKKCEVIYDMEAELLNKERDSRLSKLGYNISNTLRR